MLEINSHTHHTKKLPVITKFLSKTSRFVPVENEQNLSDLDTDEEFFFAEYTQAEIDVLIKKFEEKFNMTSEEFIKLHATSKVPDACEIILWEAFLGLE